jgi:purine-binding chemotaxis protein CheW
MGMKDKGHTENAAPIIDEAKRDAILDLEPSEEKQVISPELKQQILKERALKLARKPDSEDGEEETFELIQFMLAHEHYAIEMSYVREVYPLKDMTPVPCTPSFVLGIISLRGQVISVVDIKEFFDLPKTEINNDFRVIIVKNDDMEFGILADSVVGETKIPINRIQQDMPSLKGIRSHYVKGVTRERLILMNIDKLLSDESIIVHEEVGN